MFASLHVHSQYSVLDGAGNWEEYVARAQDLGINAISATDHGTLSGHRALQRATKGTDVKPILGIEAYFSTTDRFDRRDKGSRADNTSIYNHLIIHAMNENGLKNLNRLNEEAWNSGFYSKPRMDRELIQQYSDDIIITSACLGGPLADAFERGDFEGAYRRAEWFKKVLGDRFYIEIMAENGQMMNALLLELADDLEIKPILTEDCHYVHPDDLWVEEGLLVVNTKPKVLKGKDNPFDPNSDDFVEKFNYLYGNKSLDEGGRFTFQHNSVYMAGREERTAQLLEQGFDRQDVFDNTMEIADRIGEYPYHENLNLLPRASKGDPQKEMETLCAKGMAERGLTTKAYQDRLQHELSVIRDKGFASYFLIVSDLMRWAKSQGIMCGFARGSAAGSLVCYVLYITEVDPLEWDLSFERFLDPGRPDWPDIDVDIQDDRREEVEGYLKDKYKHTSKIMTITEYKAKNSLKDAASALKVPYGEANAVIKELPEVGATFDDYLNNPKCKEFHKKYPDVLKLAQAFEGKIKSFGVHAAAVVLSKEPISDYVPVQSAEKGAGEDKYRIPVAAYDMEETEKIGLQKIDLLGLKNLRIVKMTFDSIEKRYGKRLTLLDIPLNDKATFKMLNEGRTKGVFQAEGSAFHKWIKETGVKEFNDLVIGTSIARPGPMQTVGEIYKKRLAGREKVKYVHPVMEATLRETLGVVIYQEQLMRMVTDLAGLSVVDANGIRRTVAKKKDPALLEKYRKEFIDGASRKIKPAQAEKLWHDIEAHAGYSFNKSHAVAYSMLTNATAWLKCHYPVEYMHALMSAADKKEALTDYLIEAKRLGIKVLLPHVNKSDLEFSMEGNAIRFGLTNIKNIAEKSGTKLIAGQPYNSYQDLVKKHSYKGSGITKRIYESLNAIGAASFPDNPTKINIRENLYEILNIPNFSTTVESDRFTPLDEYTEDGAHAVFVMVREIVQKDHWTRADLMDSSGDIGIFIDKEMPLVAGQLYVMLIAKNTIVRFIPADDIYKVNDAFTDWLFEKDPGDLTEGFYRILGFRKIISQAGKKSARIVALDHEGNLWPIAAFGKSYEMAALQCRPGALRMLRLGEWNGFITLERAE